MRNLLPEPLEMRVHDHGFVRLIDVMPRYAERSLDDAVVQAARVSYGLELKTDAQDRALIRYMMCNKHTTPFEQCETKWHVRLPIFLARQWVRHRTAHLNEFSGRYSEMPDLFYVPAEEYITKQSDSNRQGGGEETLPQPELSAQDFARQQKALRDSYEAYLSRGMRKELARINLPLSQYTEWYWKCDLHNLFNFLRLRVDPHAQREIRDYAAPMLAAVRLLAPWSVEAFEDYELNAVRLSAQDILHLRGHPADLSKRELQELESKRGRLGL